jgi:hypothetical protein
MGRHMNKLEELLLNDPSAMKEFVNLSNHYRSTRALHGHLKTIGFRGEKFHQGYQVLTYIVRRLGLSKRQQTLN